ncbi:MAG: SIS domain-containing protein [Oligoflexia bacterium]|nr:SIS domain-containing protein [Oligoflexia bacterium]
MCGVIGVVTERERRSMGALAKKLLRMLEYRGYDSTGAIIQEESGKLFFAKDVGSPTVMTAKYELERYRGKLFCGQVRWATFGVVDKENAQPHLVKCKTYLYGAHNGNVTNCDQLKKWLQDEGHQVLSSNDGEMVVHGVEHFFAMEIAKGDANNHRFRRECLRVAVVEASKKMVGSYAAIIVDPISETIAAIKAGSSLYIGVGNCEEDGGAFVVASSDLASVLSQTKILYPIVENEFAIFNHEEINFYNVRSGQRVEKSAKRSKLTIEETELKEGRQYFMEQEILDQSEGAKKLIALFSGGSDLVKSVVAEYEKSSGEVRSAFDFVKNQVVMMSEMINQIDLKRSLDALVQSSAFRLLDQLGEKLFAVNGVHMALESSQSSFLEDLKKMVGSWEIMRPLKIIDALMVHEESLDIKHRTSIFADRVGSAHSKGNAIYMLACGTSYHAAKCAAYFFDRVGNIAIHPVLPGEFRGQYEHSIRPNDVIIGISQSGETKDLIDVFNLLRAKNIPLTLISIVNNTNSTLPQEKSDLYIPLCSGPEIAVPATKSFMNQLIVLYILALKVKSAKLGIGAATGEDELSDRYARALREIPALIENTIKSTQEEVQKAAEALYQEPSIHILGTGMFGLAKEGALKVREVVLNHTEGFESSEFKHGPNTILGVNTVFGLDSINALLDKFCSVVGEKELEGKNIQKLFRALADYAFKNIPPTNLSAEEMVAFHKTFEEHNFFDTLYSNYPLLFLTGPNDREINLTISQINTHKIRGSNIFLVAEENPLLRDAIRPVEVSRYAKDYKSVYITIPKTGSDIMPFFSTTVVLQLLALKMSVMKMTLLDRLEILDHGVHPDSPKNVSKSITVD